LSRQPLRRSIADTNCNGNGNSGCKRYAYGDGYSNGDRYYCT